METISRLVRATVPDYLRDLPVPDSFSGIFHLRATDWLRLTPLVTLISTTTYFTYRYLYGELDEVKNYLKKSKVNLNIKKDCAKCVDIVDIEEIGDKKVYCRCWRSKAFPLCDGSHVAHNEVTGDNVGPLIIKK